jgi:hypothetical protein
MIETKKHKYHFILMAGLFLCLFTRDIIGVSINKYLILAFIVFIFVMSNVEELVAELFFIFPLFHGLPGTYIAFAGIIIYLIKQKKHNARSIVCTMFFILLEIIASIWYPAFDLTSLVKYLSVLMLFIFLLLDDTDIDYKKCVIAYFLGLICFCFVIVASRIVEAPSNWMALFASGQFRFGELVDTDVEGIHLRSNANELGYYSLVGVCIALFLLDNVEKKTKKWVLLGLIIIALSGYLSLSRTWIVLVAVVLFLYFVRQLRSFRRTVVFTAVFWGLFYLVYRFFLTNTDLLTGIITRFNYVNTSSLNNRIPIMKSYWDAFINNPRYLFLGSGVTQYLTVIGIKESMHNMLEQIIVCYGIVGACIYFFIMIKSVMVAKRNKTSFESWIPLIGVLLYTQTSQFVNPSVLMLPYVVAVACIRIKINNEKVEERHEIHV